MAAGAWASSLAGTPIADDGVPEDGLPVANRIGGIDKASFVRLEGDELVLQLREDAGAAREAAGAAALRACVITTPGWVEAEAQSFDDAPKWDDDRCIVAQETDEVWSFDLSGFAAITGPAGFALLPADGAPPDFQIVLRRDVVR